LGVGLVLVAIAFVAGTRVADTRAGLIAESTALLAGGAGVGLLVYGFATRPRN
jgi:hypothetical protein